MSGPGDGMDVDVTAEALMALQAPPGRIADLARRPGTTATRPRGQGHEIREVRPFAEGDDLRHLDAAATARTGMLQVRSFHEDRDRTILLIADFRRPMLWGTQRLRSVVAAERLVLAGWQAIGDGGAVGVAAITDAGTLSEKPANRLRGMARVAGCLERAHALALSSVARPIIDLAPALIRAARTAPRGATIALASALDQGGGLEPAFGEILRRGALRLILPTDPFEDAPPPDPLPYFTDHGHARAAFTDLPQRRAATVAALRQMGVTIC